jgi:hypothetical protein
VLTPDGATSRPASAASQRPVPAPAVRPIDEVALNEASTKGSHMFARPIFPSLWPPGWNGPPLGFPGLRTPSTKSRTTHARAGTGHRARTWNYTLNSSSVDLQSDSSLVTCDLVSQVANHKPPSGGSGERSDRQPSLGVSRRTRLQLTIRADSQLATSLRAGRLRSETRNAVGAVTRTERFGWARAVLGLMTERQRWRLLSALPRWTVEASTLALRHEPRATCSRARASCCSLRELGHRNDLRWAPAVTRCTSR